MIEPSPEAHMNDSGEDDEVLEPPLTASPAFSNGSGKPPPRDMNRIRELLAVIVFLCLRRLPFHLFTIFILVVIFAFHLPPKYEGKYGCVVQFRFQSKAH